MVIQHKGLFTFHIWQMNGTYKIICLVILLIANIWMIKLLLNCTSVFKFLLATKNTGSLLLNLRRFYWGFKGYQTLVLFGAAAYKCKQELSKQLERGFLSKAYTVSHAKVVSDNKGIHRKGICFYYSMVTQKT